MSGLLPRAGVPMALVSSRPAALDADTAGWAGRTIFPT
ncbi:hypothetical protein RR11_2034 [Ruegeria sp. R11]|nr:hypothetical protein RR11_2034 [Ruegeria sp. R11]